MIMKTMRCVFLIMCLCLSFHGFAQHQPDAITTEWEIISQGKLQKKPRFKEPLITVRFIYENGAQFMNLSLKYMFTDAVFDEAVPVEYFKDERFEVYTDKGKYELSAARYAKARRMNTVAQKVADMRVVFGGNLSFLSNQSVKKFVVHFAQGYQNIDLNSQEASLLSKAYTNFLATLPVPVTPEVNRVGTQPVRPVVPPHRQGQQVEEQNAEVKQQALPQRAETIDDMRQRARKWNK